jgi:hypothetical protein
LLIDLFVLFTHDLFINLENSKEKEYNISKKDENESNEYNPSSDGNDKKKKKHNHKKKKKHRREKKEKLSVETTAIDLDLISTIPVDQFNARENLNDDDDTNKIPDTRYENNLISIYECPFFFSTNDYLPPKRVDSSGRTIKGHGSVVLYQIFLFNLF